MIATTTGRTQAPPAATVLYVAGEVDTFAADDLRAHLRRLPLERGGSVVVDLAAVTFMSCAALSVLAEAQSRIGPGLLLGRRSRVVSRLLELTGLTPFFTFEAGNGAVAHEPDGAAGHGPWRSGETGVMTWTFRRTDLERVRGRLMGTHGCDAEQAWSMLTGAAARHGVPVGDLVELVIGGRGQSGDAPSSAAAVAALTLLMRQPLESAADDGGRREPTGRPGRTGPISV